MTKKNSTGKIKVIIWQVHLCVPIILSGEKGIVGTLKCTTNHAPSSIVVLVVCLCLVFHFGDRYKDQ